MGSVLETMYFYTCDNIKMIHSNILQAEIAEESIDLIVTSPPYNVGIEYRSTEDGLDYQDYLKFTTDWVKKCRALAKPDGRLCMNIPLDKNKGGHNSVYADLVTIAKECGWHYFTSIVWNEGNISRRTAWGSWLSASAPFVIAPVEMIVVFSASPTWKRQTKGVSDIARQDFMDWTNGVWTFNGESKKRIGHPAPFPLELPKRCIQLFSYVGDTVLDPFMGSGTTLIACGQLKRSGIGVDVDETYCQLAYKRLREARCKA